jgi:nucleoside-diphosphate-sugar epimerase
VPRALVTGAAGFVGGGLGAALQRSGFEVRGLDLREPEGDGLDEFVRGDVRDAQAMMEAASGCDVVVDNAAAVPITHLSAAEYRSVNVDGCRVTLEAAMAAGSYVLHVSSSSIFGIPDRLPVKDETPLAPFEPYGASKAEAEGVVRRARAGGLSVASLRPRTLLGPGRLGIFDVVFSRVSRGKRVPIFGRGDNRVQLCDLDDFCAAALAAVERRASGEYNVWTAEFGTVKEDLAALIRHAGTGARLQPVPVWAIRAALQPVAALGRSPLTEWHWRSGPTSFYFDIGPTVEELGWRPERTNVDTLVNAYEHYLRRPDGAGSSPHRRPLRGAVARMLRG